MELAERRFGMYKSVPAQSALIHNSYFGGPGGPPFFLGWACPLANGCKTKTSKKSLEETCQELGLNVTTAFTIFAKKMSREKRIPFEVSVDPFYTDTNIKALEKSLDQLRQGQVVIKTMSELEAMAND